VDGVSGNPSFEASAVRPGLPDIVLREVADLIGVLADDADFVRAIDLRGLPLDDRERTQLRARLGRGEIAVMFGADQGTRIWETAYSGVWWVQFSAADGALLLEQIVVARVPEILTAHPADISAAARRLAIEVVGARPGQVDDGASA
jgi:hydrogenase-1 operon protein HyaF